MSMSMRKGALRRTTFRGDARPCPSAEFAEHRQPSMNHAGAAMSLTFFALWPRSRPRLLLLLVARAVFGLAFFGLAGAALDER